MKKEKVKIEKVFYAHGKEEKKGQNFTLAVTVIDKENSKYALFGASYCSLKDNFVKSKGRTIASGRSLKSPFKVVKLRNVKKYFSESLKMLYSVKNNIEKDVKRFYPKCSNN